MSPKVPLPSLLILVALSWLHVLAFELEASKWSYIVYLGEKRHDDPDLVTKSHHDMLTSILGSKEEAINSIIYNYKHGFSGFAAMLTESQAERIAELTEVISVKRSRSYRLHTTRSWDFLGLDYQAPTGLLRDAKYGEDVIIGLIDTGIWPESKSFDDTGYGPVPARWKGKCETAPSFGARNCSRKLIGARYYVRGVDKEYLQGEFLSPRDANGHGTHTASTAAGNAVANASFQGLAAGTARGGAPRARVAVYKACWGSAERTSCGDEQVLKAIDDAIHDGVDVLSLSLGGPGEFSGTLHAVTRGITVVFSAGNDGPTPQTVENTVPWVVTVAASTVDRDFPTLITLGNNQQFVGQSIFYEIKRNNSFDKLIYGGSCDSDVLNGTDIVGKIVLCYDPSVVSKRLPQVDIGNAFGNVVEAGGKGIIYAQYATSIISSVGDLQGFPWVLVDYETAIQIGNYAVDDSAPLVKISPTRTTIGTQVWSPKIGYFSSRGPSPVLTTVLKPDIAAPGVNMLAARRNKYVFESGTSMACPHVSGIAALLKSLHPHWSPAAIKSAIVTTASITDKYGVAIEAEGIPRKLADPFDFGGGHIEPSRAADPGLIYDINPEDYLKFFNCTLDLSTCDPLSGPIYYLNLPSISIPNLKAPLQIWRSVTNVGKVNAVYKAVLEPPPGVEMTVEPSVLVFNSTSTIHTFKVIFSPIRKVQGGYMFGSLTWRDDDTHSVRIPIAVRTVIQDFYADTS